MIPTSTVFRTQLVDNSGNPLPLTNGLPIATTDATTATRVNSKQLEASKVLKASAGLLLSLFGYNNGPAGFVQLFDAASVPADGAQPDVVFAVPTNGNFSLDVPNVGLPFSNGISACISSTPAVKTVGGANLYLTAVVK